MKKETKIEPRLCHSYSIYEIQHSATKSLKYSTSSTITWREDNQLSVQTLLLLLPKFGLRTYCQNALFLPTIEWEKLVLSIEMVVVAKLFVLISGKTRNVTLRRERKTVDGIIDGDSALKRGLYHTVFGFQRFCSKDAS